ncbi:MAG: ATP-binding cassette domain-containing protein [Kiritimatiellae bacterium]|nr:ATP-binding cassette domain-containing protein [Kiritimatiellia bacterium]
MNREVFSFAASRDAPFAGTVWTFHEGEQWVVTGPNGSGKTYLATILAGETPCRGVQVEMPEEIDGSVALLTFGQQQSEAGQSWLQARWHDSVIEDEKTVDQWLSFESVNEITPFEVRGDDAAERARFARQARLLDKLLHIAGLRDRLIVQLSNGEMRRTLLARALLKSPKLLILDDPFAGLDPAMRRELKAALDALAARGLHLVMMLRDPDEFPSCATHRLELDALRVRRMGRISVCSRTTETASRTLHLCSLSSKQRRAGRHSRCLCPEGGGARPPVLELRGVTVRYGKRLVLDRLDWTVCEGERWLLTGPNGSGKTTLFSLIAGDNPAAYGQDIRVFGQARGTGDLWEIRRRIGQVSPELQCYTDGDLTCLELIFTGCLNEEGNIERPTPAKRKEARVLLERFGLKGKERTAFGSLSTGEQRLALLARALYPHPDLLLLDEPCLNLDARARKHVLSVIGEIIRQTPSLTVLCVAHRASEVPPGMDHRLDLAGGCRER